MQEDEVRSEVGSVALRWHQEPRDLGAVLSELGLTPRKSWRVGEENFLGSGYMRDQSYACAKNLTFAMHGVVGRSGRSRWIVARARRDQHQVTFQP